MPGISEGIPGAKAYDELREQTKSIERRDANGGKPPESRILLEPQSSDEHRASVLTALGVGTGVTAQA